MSHRQRDSGEGAVQTWHPACSFLVTFLTCYRGRHYSLAGQGYGGLAESFVPVPAAHLDGHVVDVQAEGDALVESQLRFPGGVDVNHLFGLDVSLLMIDAGLNHTVPDSLWAPKGRKGHLLSDACWPAPLSQRACQIHSPSWHSLMRRGSC